MPLPEFCIAIWLRPHKGSGYFVEIDASLIDDGLPGGVFQSAADLQPGQRSLELHPDNPHREFSVTVEQLLSLVTMADQIQYSFAEHPYSPRTSSSRFGVKVARGYQEVQVEWLGTFEDQDEPIQRLYLAVSALAGA
jgi:hypothetical protein